MKRIEFPLTSFHKHKFFPEYRVKEKGHIIEILMEATRYMLLDHEIDTMQTEGNVILYVDKMSRLFFVTENKYFSIVFPFTVAIKQDADKAKYLFSFSGIEVDYQLIDQVIKIIKCDAFKETCSLDFVAPICDYEEHCDENFWIFLRELLLMEDGYIRYDYDEESYRQFLAQDKVHQHPLNHYDFFYSAKATFKIGLDAKISNDEFIDLVNSNTNCFYMSKRAG